MLSHIRPRLNQKPEHIQARLLSECSQLSDNVYYFYYSTIIYCEGQSRNPFAGTAAAPGQKLNAVWVGRDTISCPEGSESLLVWSYDDAEETHKPDYPGDKDREAGA